MHTGIQRKKSSLLDCEAGGISNRKVCHNIAFRARYWYNTKVADLKHVEPGGAGQCWKEEALWREEKD